MGPRALGTLAAAGCVALALAPAAYAPPRAGTFVPGESLGGVRLAMTEDEVLAADASDVARIYGSLDERQCARYEALLLPGKKVTSVFYVFRDKVWGFGLMRPEAPPCL